jgi:hypothetical protein
MEENLCTAAPAPNPEHPGPDPEEEARFEAGLKAAMEMANKHGYYYSVLGEQERIDYVMALAHDDEDEIALLRAQIKAVLAINPYNFSVFARLVGLLERMRRGRRAASMHQDKTEQLKKAVENVFTSLNLPLELMRDGFPPQRGPALSPGLTPA